MQFYFSIIFLSVLRLLKFENNHEDSQKNEESLDENIDDLVNYVYDDRSFQLSDEILQQVVPTLQPKFRVVGVNDNENNNDNQDSEMKLQNPKPIALAQKFNMDKFLARQNERDEERKRGPPKPTRIELPDYVKPVQPQCFYESLLSNGKWLIVANDIEKQGQKVNISENLKNLYPVNYVWAKQIRRSKYKDLSVITWKTEPKNLIEITGRKFEKCLEKPSKIIGTYNNMPRRRRISIFGDSRMRQFIYTFEAILANNFTRILDMGSHSSYASKSTKIHFTWCTTLREFNRIRGAETHFGQEMGDNAFKQVANAEQDHLLKYAGKTIEIEEENENTGINLSLSDVVILSPF